MLLGLGATSGGASGLLPAVLRSCFCLCSGCDTIPGIEPRSLLRSLQLCMHLFVEKNIFISRAQLLVFTNVYTYNSPNMYREGIDRLFVPSLWTNNPTHKDIIDRPIVTEIGSNKYYQMDILL